MLFSKVALRVVAKRFRAAGGTYSGMDVSLSSVSS